MADKSLKEEINAVIPADLKAKFKAIFSRFNLPPVAPVAAAPAAPVAPQAPTQLTEATLADGTVIKYDTPSLAQGSVVTVVTPEGEMPCPEGEHKLQDGTVIKVVSQEGKSVVESVTPATPEAPAAPAAQSAAPVVTPEQVAAIQKVLTGYEAQFSAVKKEKDELQEQFNALKKDVADFMATFQEFVDTPSAAPIEKPKNKFSSKGLNKFINRTI